ncbi:TetR/AcrR family transcriptional regulator [Amycolatopsis sp. PS_44_ISF1]|uniref:TetR/AcrR family transcriptional regulator n=1 Tax=Amycolatopsis sp. PS_44_ISF1 TaxID=2974917 RepID=UPI0028DD4289|nr:TetR/AcrR family transcriptional regulator [Amycolatopsis sp. PS_44_ISF1]MDT8914105.1 TetR/AcrR family transcriptional regulator [Amycolatopsis sp. PS_44_ISF1]
MAGRKQFDIEGALDAAMTQFWRAGYADSSVDDLCRATGLNRSSLYATFGDKDSLFRRCLERYVERYGESYDAALSSAGGPVEAVRAFFEVTLGRIADPALPDGCLMTQSALAVPGLSPEAARRVREAVDAQRNRLFTALKANGLPGAVAEPFALHIAAVNQSLAVMSRAGVGARQLRAVIEVTLDALGGRT